MPHATRMETPRWLSPAAVGWAALALSLLVLTLAGSFVAYEWREAEHRELSHAEVHARVLEDHANRSFAALDITLATLDESIISTQDNPDLSRINPLFVQALRGLPLLRSLSYIDLEGTVLASSNAALIGQQLQLDKVPLPGLNRTDRLGPLVPGRDLDAAVRGAPSARPQAALRHFMPLVRGGADALGRPRYLVAVLNPEFFTNEHSLILGAGSWSSALTGMDGALLSATEGIARPIGERMLTHPAFTDFLPQREHGSFIGPGIDERAAVTAFRLLRNRPLAVIVEGDYTVVRGAMLGVVGKLAALCAVVLMLIATMAALARRSLRSHQAVQAALAATRADVTRSEHNLRALVESVHEVIFRTEADGRINYMNGRWTEVSGRRAQDALGERLADLCLPDDRPAIEGLFQPQDPALAEPQMVRVLTPEGLPRTLEVSVAAVRDASGTLTGYAGFAMDVSERQVARERLQAQLELNERLFEVSPAPLFVKDVVGRYIAVNRAWLDLMVLPQDQVIGRSAAELAGDQGDRLNEHDLRLLATGQRVSYDFVLHRPDGEQRDTVVTQVRFHDAKGASAGIIGSIIDVTEFREAERVTREARDAAERANRAKTDFLANISHELRTPLQAIIGFSDLAHDHASGDALMQDMLCDIQGGGRRMLTLVNGLLDIAKSEGMEGQLTRRRQDLVDLSNEVLRELRPLAEARQLRFEPLDGTRPLIADVDAFRVQQVIRNVLANAMRFAPDGSSIELRGSDLGAAGVVLSIRDHGPGIPADEIEAIFDPFVQSSRTRDGAGGTGLGLTICRRIMRAHGGSIDASNAPDGGAVIHIRVPAAAPLAATTTSVPSPMLVPESPPATEALVQTEPA